MEIGGMLRGFVGAVVIIAAACVTWPLQMVAIDGVYKQFINYCESNGEAFTRLYTRSTEDADLLDLSGYIQLTFDKTGSEVKLNCDPSTAWVIKGSSLATSAVIVGTGDKFIAGAKLYSEQNERVQAAVIAGSAGSETLDIPSAKFKKPKLIVDQYDDLSLTILGAVPVIGVVGFLGMASVNYFRMRGGGDADDISRNVMWGVGGLVLMVAQTFVAPIIITLFNFAYVMSGGTNIAGGPFQALNLFGDLLQLVFEFLVPLYILSMLSGVAWGSWRTFRGDIKDAVGSFRM